MVLVGGSLPAGDLRGENRVQGSESGERSICDGVEAVAPEKAFEPSRVRYTYFSEQASREFGAGVPTGLGDGIVDESPILM